MKRYLIGTFALAASAATIAGCGGGSNNSSSTTSSTTTAQATAAAMGGNTMAKGKAARGAGASVFNTNCSSCHGASGTGMAGSFPPLAGNPDVSGPPTKIIHIVKYGLHGPLKVKGQTYNGQMPAWSPQLGNDQIAGVVTYIRTSWGNHGSAVTPQQVASVKK